MNSYEKMYESYKVIMNSQKRAPIPMEIGALDFGSKLYGFNYLQSSLASASN